MSPIRIALVQTRTPADQASALAHTRPLIEQAIAGGAQWVLTPEGSNFLQRDRGKFAQIVASVEDDAFIQGVRDMAKASGVPILIGSALVRRDDGLFANRCLSVGAGGEIETAYDKIHMFDVDLPNGERHRESAVYAPGDRAVLAGTPLGLTGLTICYDLRFAGLYRTLAQSGAGVLTVPAAFTRPTGEAHWEVLLRARAIENGAYVLAPAQGGIHEDGRATWGRSTVVAPWGEVIAAAVGDEPDVIFADIDLAAVQAARAAVPSLVNGRAFAAP